MDRAASYYDGSTPRRRSAVVRADDDALTILDAEDGPPRTRRPAADVRLLAETGSRTDVRLRCGRGDDRLVVDGGTVPRWLADACPNLQRADAGDGRFWRRTVAWTAIAAVAVVVLIRFVIPALAGQIVALVPVAAEQRFGERLAERAIETFAYLEKRERDRPAICSGAEGIAAIGRLKDVLVSRLDAPPPITVTVVRTKLVNAIALPGGQIVVFKGLLDFAENGNEVAGVLAHEIAHVDRRHPLRYVIEESATSALIGVVLGDVFGGGVVAGLARLLVTTRYTGEKEREADAVGVALMNETGFDAAGLASFLERLGKKHADLETAFAYLSSHPTTGERVAAIRARATGGRAAFSDREWAAVRRMCDGS